MHFYLHVSSRLLLWGSAVCFSCLQVNAQIPLAAPHTRQALLNEPINISADFRNFANT